MTRFAGPLQSMEIGRHITGKRGDGSPFDGTVCQDENGEKYLFMMTIEGPYAVYLGANSGVTRSEKIEPSKMVGAITTGSNVTLNLPDGKQYKGILERDFLGNPFVRVENDEGVEGKVYLTEGQLKN